MVYFSGNVGYLLAFAMSACVKDFLFPFTYKDKDGCSDFF